MSFRSGPSIKLIVNDLVAYTIKVVNLNQTSVFGLNIVLHDVGIIISDDSILFVKRNDRLFIIISNRDIEELGSHSGEEKLYVSSKNNLNLDDVMSLSKYQMGRKRNPCKTRELGDVYYIEQKLIK